MGPCLSNISALSIPPASDPPSTAPTRSERVLLAALALSVAVHLLGVSGAADWLSEQFRSDAAEPGPPLRTVLRPPPPPTYQAPPQPAPPKPKPKPKARPRPVTVPVIAAPAPAADPVPTADPVPALADASGPVTQEAMPAAPAPAVQPPAPLPEAPPPPPPEKEPGPEPAPAATQAPARSVPKRIDLVGTVYVGEQNFMIGAGGFRLRHDGNRYEISVLGQPKGLARLLLGGEFTGTSRGAITPNGLQPSEYVEERGRPDRRESAMLDWEAGVIHLKDDKIVPIEPPVYDRLSVIMQFYYRPPDAHELSMRVTGTRSVDTYAFRREANEQLELAFGVIDAHRWRANFEDGDPRLEIWMSPEYSYLPLRIRVHARKANGGRYATLNIDEIRVED